MMIPLAAEPTGQPPAPLGTLARSIVLVGLMGAGKTSIGRRLARTLDAAFQDADEEIVQAAGMSIPDIFASVGEPAFRDLERRVIARLLDGQPAVLALGGGAFVDASTRERVKATAVSVWLKADLDTLVARTARRRATRPLLKDGDPRATLARLMEERHPLYMLADLAVDTGEEATELVLARVLDGIRAAGALR